MTSTESKIFEHVNKFNPNKSFSIWKTQFLSFIDLHDLQEGLTESCDNDKIKKKLKYLLINSLDQETLSLLALNITQSNAHQIWTRLNQLKESKSIATKQTVKMEFLNLKMKQEESIQNFVSRINNVVIKLQDLNIGPNDEEKLCVLTSGLSNNFNSFRDSLLAQDDLNYIKTCDKLLSYEESTKLRKSVSKNEFKIEKQNNAMEIINYANNNHNKNKLFCTYCKKNSHSITQCWKRNKVCFGCKKTGHQISNCPLNKNKQQNNKSNYKSNHNSNQKSNESSCNYVCSVLSNDQVTSKDIWLLDSGATSHITHNEDELYDIQETNQTVKLANDKIIKVSKIGKIDLQIKNIKLTLTDVKYAPDFKINLLSISKFSLNNFKVNFYNATCEIKFNNKIIISSTQENGLYPIKASCDYVNYSQTLDTIQHNKLGHCSNQVIKSLVENKSIIGLNKIPTESTSNCSSCMTGKAPRKAFKSYTSREESTHPLQLIHLDVCQVLANLYYSLIVDDYSRRPAIKIIQQKSETASHIMNWITLQEKQSPHKCKQVISDGGGEYNSDELKNYFLKQGIKHQMTTRECPAVNGTAERANRNILSITRCILHESKLGINFIKQALIYACYIMQFKPCVNDKTKTCFQMFFNRKPRWNHLNVFGSDCWIYSFPNNKISSRYHKAIFVGLSQTRTNAYIVFDLELNKIIESRDIKIMENQFNYGNRISNVSVLQNQLNSINDLSKEDREEIINDSQKPIESSINVESWYKELQTESNQNQNANQIESDVNESLESHQNESNQNESDEKESNEIESDQNDLNQNDLNQNTNRKKNLAQSKQDKIKAQLLRQGITTENMTDSLRNRRKSPTYLPSERDCYDEDIRDLNLDGNNVNDKNNESDNHALSVFQNQESNKCHVDFEYALTIFNTNDIITPQSFEEAVNSPQQKDWLNSIENEVKSIHDNQTYVIVKDKNELTGQEIIHTRWVFRVKFDDESSKNVFKSRIVAKGFQQSTIEDVFSPTLKFKNLKLILALSNSFKYQIFHYDICTAFLNAQIDEPTYILLPKGFGEDSLKVACLQKSLYGLRKSPLLWFKCFSNFITECLNFKSIITDECLFVRWSNNKNPMFLLLYVDDIVFSYDSNDLLEANNLRDQIFKKFKSKNLGQIKNILSISIERDTESRILKLNQKQAIQKLINEFNLQNAIPMNKLPNEKLEKVNETPQSCLAKPIRKMIGMLSWISMITRCDISFSVNQLSRHSNNFNESHWNYGIKIIKYLKFTINQCLIMKCNNRNQNEIDLTCFSDSSFNDIERKASSFGYILFINHQAIHWTSSILRSTCLSTCESEYLSLSKASTEAIYFRQLIQEILPGYKIKTILKSDNQAAIQLTKHAILHQRSKHIEIRFHHIRSLVSSKQIEIQFVDSVNQTADIFTKSLNEQVLNRLKSQIPIS